MLVDDCIPRAREKKLPTETRQDGWVWLFLREFQLSALGGSVLRSSTQWDKSRRIMKSIPWKSFQHDNEINKPQTETQQVFWLALKSKSTQRKRRPVWNELCSITRTIPPATNSSTRRKQRQSRYSVHSWRRIPHWSSLSLRLWEKIAAVAPTIPCCSPLRPDVTVSFRFPQDLHHQGGINCHVRHNLRNSVWTFGCHSLSELLHFPSIWFLFANILNGGKHEMFCE